MSNLSRIDNLEQIIKKQEVDFNRVAKAHGAVNFMKEASFAMQILKGNDYLMKCALENQDSLKMAIINVAGIGLTLNPLRALAYLVPRKGTVCLDPSYRGYVHLAAEAGAIHWVKAERVFSNDKYEYNGMGVLPTHIFEPFDMERGKVVGLYCAAKTKADEYIIDHMTIDEVYAIRDRSESWKAYKDRKIKTCPWVTDESEMQKKTIIRRAQKMWPIVNASERFVQAVELGNAADPVLLAAGGIGGDLAKHIEDISKIRQLCELAGRKEEVLVAHLARGARRKIDKLEDLTEHEAHSAIVMLEGIVKKEKK